MLRKLMPHAVIILSMMYFVFFFIDRVNASMGFINNRITKGLLFALCVLAIGQAVALIRADRRRVRALARRSQAKSAAQAKSAPAKPAARAATTPARR